MTVSTDVKTRWDRVAQRLRAELGEDLYTSWFARMELEGLDNDTVRLSVPTRFLRSWIQSHYVEKLLTCWQSEVAEIQRRYKGDRTRIAEAQRDLYKSRGVNPLSGCLPTLLQFFVLIPMYTVIQNGLTNPDPTAMLAVFGFKFDIACVNGLGTSAYDNMKPCIDTVVPWIGNLDVSQPWAPIALAGIGISPLAIGSALLQVIQTRMTIKPGVAAGADANAAAAQNQSLIILPFISVLYGGILPAGLFIYWIASTVFSIVQQYFIIGFGGLFPLFGWIFMRFLLPLWLIWCLGMSVTSILQATKGKPEGNHFINNEHSAMRRCGGGHVCNELGVNWDQARTVWHEVDKYGSDVATSTAEQVVECDAIPLW